MNVAVSRATQAAGQALARTLGAVTTSCLRSEGRVATKKHVTFCPIILERAITPESRESPLELEHQPAGGIEARVGTVTGQRLAKESTKKTRRKSLLNSDSNSGTRPRCPREELRPTKRQNKEIISLIEKMSAMSCVLRKERAQGAGSSVQGLKHSASHDFPRVTLLNLSKYSEKSSSRTVEAASEHEMRREVGAVSLRRQLRRSSLSPDLPRGRPQPWPKTSDPPITRRRLPKSSCVRAVIWV